MIRNSIRNKLILFLLAATLVPFVTSILITYQFTKQKVTEDAVSNNSALIKQGTTNLMNYLNGVVQASLTIYTNEKRYTILQQPEIDYLSDKEISSGLQVMSHSVKEIQQIYLYAEASNRSYLMVKEVSQHAAGKYPGAKPFPDGKDVYFAPTHISTGYGVTLSPYVTPANVISMHRKIINFPENRVLGELVIDVNMNLIATISGELYEAGQEELYILDQDGHIVYGPDSAEWGKPLAEEWGARALDSDSADGSYEWTKDGFAGIHLYRHMRSDYVDWTIVKRVPYEQLYKNARQLTLINSLVLSFFLIIAVICTVLISIRFTAPIKELIRYITKIQAGNLNAGIELQRTDELGILANRFHTLMQNLNQLMMREYRLELANKSNQLRALQAQMNPHFLNNALQSIGTLALQHGAPKIYALIASLAKMMRYSMSTHESIVPLRKELEHVKAFLELQQQRFAEQLAAVFEIEERALDVQVPKMILQPLAENYFKHGFAPGAGAGLLRLSIRLTEDGGQTHLHIRLDDNGKGVTEERLQEIRGGLEGGLAPEGIGLSNIAARLKLFFSNEAELYIDHNRRSPEPGGRGLSVAMIIPLQKEKDI